MKRAYWNMESNPSFRVNAGKTINCEMSVTIPEKARAVPISFEVKSKPPFSLVLAV